MSLFPGFGDPGAAGARLAAGHPGSTAGPCRAPSLPVLTTVALYGPFSAAIPPPSPPPPRVLAVICTPLWSLPQTSPSR